MKTKSVKIWLGIEAEIPKGSGAYNVREQPLWG